MKSSRTLLSVCIPTYNRLHYLRESLEALLPQAQPLGVDVFVSDNHSTDGTHDYLQAKQRQFTCLHFSIQESNVGLERNMLEAIGNGRGRYILPIGDDEVLPPGALSIISEELNDAPDLLLLNGWHTDAKLEPRQIHLAVGLAGAEFRSAPDAFEELWDKMPPGSFLATRECFLNEYSKIYIGTSHAYAGAVWEALAAKQVSEGGCTVKCMSKPVVLFRGGDKSWRKDAAVIMLYEIPRWFSLLQKNIIYRGVADRIRLTYLRQITRLPSLMRFQAAGQLTPALIELLKTEYGPRQIKKIRGAAGVPVFIAGWITSLRDLHASAKQLLHRHNASAR